MIASPATFALLLLSFQSTCHHHQANAEHPTDTKSEGGSLVTPNGASEKQTHSSLRQVVVSRMDNADESAIIGTARFLNGEEDDNVMETEWPTYTPTSFDETTPEFIATSTYFESGYMRDPTTTTDDIISISSEEETPWPTYFPTAFATRAPTIGITPTLGIASSLYNCDPVGSRTNNNDEKPSPPTPPRPTTANPMSSTTTTTTTVSTTPASDPTTPSSFSPVFRPTRRPVNEEHEDPSVTFRRGDMLKKIERLGIKGKEPCAWHVVVCFCRGGYETHACSNHQRQRFPC